MIDGNINFGSQFTQRAINYKLSEELGFINQELEYPLIEQMEVNLIVVKLVLNLLFLMPRNDVSQLLE
jgi:hypothetical protein